MLPARLPQPLALGLAASLLLLLCLSSLLLGAGDAGPWASLQALFGGADEETRFVVGVRKFLSDETHAFYALFRAVAPDVSGALPVDVLARNLGALVAEGHDAGNVITEALNELTFFMLFQCGELLDPQSDEHLGRRVRLIHASLR